MTLGETGGMEELRCTVKAGSITVRLFENLAADLAKSRFQRDLREFWGFRDQPCQQYRD
jgi:hypothetical protein